MLIILVMGLFTCVVMALLTHENQYDYEYIEEEIRKRKENQKND